MTKLKIFLTIFACLLGFTAFSQTNSFYQGGEFDFQVAPIVFYPVINKSSIEEGISIESMYYQTPHTATSLEAGCNNLKKTYGNPLSYYSVKQYYRVVPFYNQPILGRIELFSYLGADKYVNDGGIGASLGVGLGYAISTQFRLIGDFSEHFASTTQDTGLFAKAFIQIKF